MLGIFQITAPQGITTHNYENNSAYRANPEGWEKRIGQILAGEACLSLRYWSGKPYKSVQGYIATLKESVGYQRFQYFQTTIAMKSVNALEYLHSTSDEKEFLEMTDLLPLHDAIKAVEIAEADRDARAVEAHRTSCESFYQGGCCGPHEPCIGKCSYLKRFIEKLNEE